MNRFYCSTLQVSIELFGGNFRQIHEQFASWSPKKEFLKYLWVSFKMQAPERSGCEEGFSNHKSIFHIVHDINMCIIWRISILDNSQHFSVKRKKVHLLDRERSFSSWEMLKN